MKYIYLLLIILLTGVNGLSQDLRNVSWGMSQNEVRQIESLELFQKACANTNDCILTYRDRISGDSAYVWYRFLYDSLSSIKYQLYLSSTSPDSYYHMFKFVDLLSRKYGKPLEAIWDCKDQKSKYYVEKAIDRNYEFVYLFWDGSIKEIVYKWQTNNTFIFLNVVPTETLVNGRKIVFPSIYIVYYSYNHDRLEEKSKNEHINNKL